MVDRNGKKPKQRDKAPEPADDGRAPDGGYPLLCLRHLQPGWGFEELNPDHCREFLVKWAKRATLTWKELIQHDRHGLGFEKLPSSAISASVPEYLEQEKYLVFRHEGNRPFAGFRSGDTFHVLWVERNWNDLYQH